MIKMATAVLLLALCAGSALAVGNWTYGGIPGNWAGTGPREDICQYGFQDDTPGSGYTLGLGYQLGIVCPGPITVTGVGFYVEFIVTGGQVDIVIQDNGVEVSRTTVTPAQGVNEFDIPDVQVNGDACIIICPIGNYWSVLGEDYSHGPNQSSWQSQNCTCSGTFLDSNLTIWAHTGGATATEPVSWGSLKMLYR